MKGNKVYMNRIGKGNSGMGLHKKPYGNNKTTGEEFKLYFKDEDGEPQIEVKDVFALFDKEEIH